MNESDRSAIGPLAISRRKLLGISIAGLGMMAVSGCGRWQGSAPGNNIGLQLYTLRDLMTGSVAETLELVAGVGYTELEFAGYFSHSPKTLREIIDGEGLTAPATHILLDDLRENPESSIEAAHIMGHKYIVVPYLDERQRGTGIDAYRRLADEFNALGEQCSKAGLKFAYHNHAFEFDKVDEQIPYDVLLAETDPKHVFMELDLYWVTKAQSDPVTYFRNHAGRFPLWHVKDMDESGGFADVGQGIVDFERIFAAADIAGLEHKFVERDHTDDPVRTIRIGYEAMARLSGVQET